MIVEAISYKKTTYKLFDQLKHICNVFSNHILVLNRYMDLIKYEDIH